MAGLSTYVSEIGGIAEELAQILRGPLRKWAYSALSELGEAGLSGMSQGELDQALRLLSQTPSQRSKTLSRLDDNSAAILVMRARYLCISGGRALSIADDLSFVPGRGYRDAAAHCARHLMRTPLYPSLEEVLPGWGLHNAGLYDDNEDGIDDETAWRP